MTLQATAAVRAAIYARISDDRDGLGLGVTRQLDDCRKLAANRDWPVVTEFTDNDVSAYSGKPRPAYRQMLDAIANGEITAIVAWHPDRLHRSTRELEDFIDLVQRQRVDVATVTAGVYDLTTPAGQMTAKIVGAVAQQESQHKAIRQRRKHEELARAGKFAGGGTRPYGYTYRSKRAEPNVPDDDRSAIVPTEAAVICDLAARALAGESLRALTADLNARGVPSVTGKPWTTQVMRRVLLSARISGQRSYGAKRPGGGDIVADAVWPAIITPEQTARLRAMLTDPRRVTLRAARRYLLTHMLRCHNCGSRMVARPRVDKVRRYVCPGNRAVHGTCGKTFILSEPLEALVSEMALQRLDSPEFDRAVREYGRNAVNQHDDASQLDADRRRLDELAAMWADGAVSRREYLIARDRIADRISTAERRQARDNGTSAIAPLAGTARKRWPSLTFDQQRAVLRSLFAGITIGPGKRGFNRFDPARVHPEWAI